MAIVNQHDEFAQKKKPPTEDEKRYYNFILFFWIDWLYVVVVFLILFVLKIKEGENCGWEFDESFDETWCW
jgi:hypothetical protein